MEIINNTNQTVAIETKQSEDEIIEPTLRLLREFAQKDMKVSHCYASIAAELRAIVKIARK